ncbi:MAG: hypothetical protein RIQ93_580 [Verrucomicrobiota bacterium]|jgi:hypothetical protein
MRLVRLALLSFVCLLGAAALQAQSARWDPPGGSLPVGQSTALRLVFEGCSPKDEPTPPKVDGLTLQLYGKGSNTSIVNGTMSVSEVFTFAAALTKNQRVEIPAFTVETTKGNLRVPAARFDPGAATVGRTGAALTDAASARITVSPPSVWAGEVFELTASVGAARSYYPQFTRGFDWTPDPLIAEAWSDPQQVEYTSGGDQHTGFTYRARALARTAGRFNLNAATHIVNLSVGVSGFGFFQQRQYDQYSITSNTPALEVKALPPAPPGFTGAVGQFKLVSKVVPEKAAVGEPVTWTLELSGTANWPDIAGLPSRNVSNDFQVVQPKARRTPLDTKIFDVTLTEDVVLVPGKSGSYVLGPVDFTYFDPKSGSYKTVGAPRTTVLITPPSAPQFNLNAPPAVVESASPTPTTSRPAPAAPAAPSRIPRDPLPGSDEVLAPLQRAVFLTWMIAPVVLLVGFWLWLALREAARTDPLRARREARARLTGTLNRLQSASPVERPVLLLAWQRDAAVLWRVNHAAPPPSALSEASWSTLWRESDRALYGAATDLPVDWVSRAEAALAGHPVASFNPLRLFLRRNLMPFAASLLFLLVASASALRAAEDAGASYRRGEFAAAEKSWRGSVASRPTDWISRHNLSLSLSQLDRPGDAAGQATAAFVQNPADPSVRWHFGLACEKAGFAPAGLAAFLAPGPVQLLARAASPSRWQLLVIGTAFGLAAALGMILYNAYGRRSRAVLFTASAFALGFISLGATSATAIHAYGATADQRAVLVARSGALRSIPTEADTNQKTTPLAAGVVAVADQTFLGWLRLSFANGQTGWVRKDDVVALWR